LPNAIWIVSSQLGGSLADVMDRLESLPTVMVSILTPRARWLVECFGKKYNDMQVRAGFEDVEIDKW
jgi:hypothetical protein